MNFEIISLYSVGGIPFGMHRDKVLESFVERPRQFLRNKFAKFPCDHFPNLGIFLYYDVRGMLEAAEFTKPARPLLRGNELLGLDLAAARGILSGLGGELIDEVDGVFSNKLGVSIYAPLGKNDATAKVESVTAFTSEYYALTLQATLNS